MWPVTLATATGGEMPRKINSGVIRKPPPMPNMPEMKPTASPIARMTKMLTGDAGDREVNLHALHIRRSRPRTSSAASGTIGTGPRAG